MTPSETIGVLILAEKESALPTADFWKALQRCATNEPLLRSLLQNGRYVRAIPDSIEPQKPIEIE